MPKPADRDLILKLRTDRKSVKEIIKLVDTTKWSYIVQ